MSKLAAAFIAATVAFAAPVFAQEQAIVLRIDSGTALTSTGGDFASANTGTALIVGQKVLINEQSSAVVVYSDGCEIKFDKPGVYEIPSECKRGAWVADPQSHVNTWVIVGGALIGAALLGNGGENDVEPPPPPLSTGSR